MLPLKCHLEVIYDIILCKNHFRLLMLVLITGSSALSIQACTFPVAVVKITLQDNLIRVKKGETQNIHLAQKISFLP